MTQGTHLHYTGFLAGRKTVCGKVDGPSSIQLTGTSCRECLVRTDELLESGRYVVNGAGRLVYNYGLYPLRIIPHTCVKPWYVHKKV